MSGTRGVVFYKAGWFWSSRDGEKRSFKRIYDAWCWCGGHERTTAQVTAKVNASFVKEESGSNELPNMSTC